MIRFIVGIRSPKHLAASWPDVRGSGGEAEVGWPVGQWGQLQESSFPRKVDRLVGRESAEGPHRKHRRSRDPEALLHPAQGRFLSMPKCWYPGRPQVPKSDIPCQ